MIKQLKSIPKKKVSCKKKQLPDVSVSDIVLRVNLPVLFYKRDPAPRGLLVNIRAGIKRGPGKPIGIVRCGRR